MRISTRNKLYDGIQRVWVSTCMGVSVALTAYIAYSVAQYFLYVKPIKKELEEQVKHELLKEGMLKRDPASLTANKM